MAFQSAGFRGWKCWLLPGHDHMGYTWRGGRRPSLTLSFFLKKKNHFFVAALVLVAAHRLSLVAGSEDCSTAAAQGLSCPMRRGIFPDQGLNQCPLPCKADL